MGLLSGLLLVAAVLAWGSAHPWRRVRARTKQRRVDPAPRLVPVLVVGVATLAGAGWVIGSVRAAVLATLAGACLSAAVWTLANARRGRRQARARDEVAQGASELAALLRAGHAPGRALQVVARAAPCFGEPAAHFAIGGDVTDALRRGADRPGYEGLRGLAAAWRTAQRTGASMTSFLDELSAQLAAERELGRSVATELAAARLTGRLLGFLPLVGIVLGYAVGGDPVAFLLSSDPGLWCLTAGVGLAVAGVVWSEKLAERAGRLR
ncbi:type II secretion system F family protein [Micropruina sp.]|uniref:type II secretion system F family protein n=1 Tax=Micropruina sp. TaxID=2737536 RepID=UPI0039E6752B